MYARAAVCLEGFCRRAGLIFSVQKTSARHCAPSAIAVKGLEPEPFGGERRARKGPRGARDKSWLNLNNCASPPARLIPPKCTGDQASIPKAFLNVLTLSPLLAVLSVMPSIAVFNRNLLFPILRRYGFFMRQVC